MALWESLDRQDQIAASPAATTQEQIVGAVRLALLAVLLVGWVAGAYAGIVYWSLQGSLLGVIASAILPGLAATSTWSAFAALERSSGRRR
jgi:hypothetical protein